MTFDQALIALKKGATIWHPFLEEDEYLEATITEEFNYIGLYKKGVFLEEVDIPSKALLDDEWENLSQPETKTDEEE